MLKNTKWTFRSKQLGADKSVEAVLSATDDAEKSELVNQKFLPKARNLAVKLPFVRDLLAGYNCVLDNETPRSVKAAIIIPLAYFVMPVDAIPDIIPAAGYTDDLGLWLASVKLFGSHINPSHYEKADFTIQSSME